MHFGCSLDFHNVLPGNVIGVLYAPCIVQGGTRKIFTDLPKRRLYMNPPPFLLELLELF